MYANTSYVAASDRNTLLHILSALPHLKHCITECQLGVGPICAIYEYVMCLQSVYELHP